MVSPTPKPSPEGRDGPPGAKRSPPKKDTGAQPKISKHVDAPEPFPPLVHREDMEANEIDSNNFKLTVEPELILWQYSITVKAVVKAEDVKMRQAKGPKLQRIVQLFLNEKSIHKIGTYATDGKSILLVNHELDKSLMDYKVVKYKGEDEDDPRGNAAEYLVQLVFSRSLRFRELLDHLQGREVCEDRLQFIQALNIVIGSEPKADRNILSAGPNQHHSFVAPAKGNKDLGGGLETWRGYLTSVRVARPLLLLNVQIRYVVAYHPGELSALIDQYWKSTGEKSGKFDADKLGQFLKGVRVQTNHLEVRKNKAGRSIPRIKTICGLATMKDASGQEPKAEQPKISRDGARAEDVQFYLKPKDRGSGAGKHVTVFQFFKDVHKRTVENEHPVVNVGTAKNPVYLPVDVCKVLPGQRAPFKLSPAQTVRMIEIAVRKPESNAASICGEGLKTLGLKPRNATLTHLGIALGQYGIKVPAHLLPTPSVKYHEGASVVKDLCTWNMKDLRVAHPRNLKSWAICQVHKSGSGIIANDRLNELSRLFAEVLSKTGITVESQAEIQFIDFNGHDESIVDKSIRAMKGRKFQIVLVILPKEDSLLYRLVKFYGDVKHGLSTVCVDRPNFDKLKSSVPVFANIALKFNLKLGGVNQTLDGHDLGIIQYENTMIVGLGMTHPSSGSSSAAPTVAAMVATVDNTLGQWPGTLRVQTGSEEIIQDLGPMLRSRLILWRQAHSGKSPENIIVYRNGVSEGQYNEVRTNEIPRLKDGCTDLYTPAKVKNGLPRFTVIVVGKRHNTRFYALPSDLASAKKPASESTPEKATPNQKGGPTPQTPKDGGKGKSKLQSPKNGFRSGQKSQAQKEGGKDGPKTLAPTDGNKPSFNPKNGTIVDECLADPDLGFGMWEFYLTSHKANKGTVRPAHYVVICDEIWGAKDLKMAPNDRAKIIQDLTHNMCYLWGRSTTSVSYAPAAYYADKLCARARHYLKGYYEPSSDAPAATDDTGKGQREPTKKQEDLVQIHHDLKDTMFYI